MLLRNNLRHPWPAIAVVLLFVMVIAYQIWNMHLFRTSTDEGILLASAMRIAHGEVMYKDFFEFWTPGAVYVFGWLFKVAGQDWWVVRLAYLVCSVGLLVVVYLITGQAKLNPRARLFVMLVVTLATQSLYVNSHHWFGQAGMLLTLLALLLAVNHPRWLFRLSVMAGLIAGLTTVFMQYEGAVAMIGGLLGVIYISPRTDRLKHVAVYLAGVVVVGIVVLFYFATQGALSSLLYSTVVFPLSQYGSVNTGPINTYWQLQALMLVSMIICFRHRPVPQQIRLIMIFAVLMQLAGLSTRGEFHPLFGGSLLCILLVWWASQARLPKLGKSVIMQVFMQPLVKFVPAFGFGLLIALYVASTASLISTGMENLLVRAEYQQIDLPIGQLVIEKTGGQRIEQVRSAVQPAINRGEYVYFGPYIPYFYYLLQTPNPTAYSQITPKYNPDWMVQRAAESIQQTRSAYVVLLPSQSTFDFGIDNSIYRLLEQQYKLIQILPTTAHSKSTIFNNTKVLDAPDSIWQLKP